MDVQTDGQTNGQTNDGRQVIRKDHLSFQFIPTGHRPFPTNVDFAQPNRLPIDGYMYN